MSEQEEKSQEKFVLMKEQEVELLKKALKIAPNKEVKQKTQQYIDKLIKLSNK